MDLVINTLLLIGIATLLYGGIVLTYVLIKKKGLGILNRKRTYQDTEISPGEILVSSSVPLKGKPDYIIQEKNGALIPVEIKTGRTPRNPYPNHIMQLAAYCLLVEENYKKPEYGIIKYPDAEFKIEYTAQLKNTLLSIIREVQNNKRIDTEIHCKHTYHYL